jgi:hypothetical protein
MSDLRSDMGGSAPRGGDWPCGQPTPTQQVRNIMRQHLREIVGFQVLDMAVDAAMEGMRESKPIIAEIIDRERGKNCEHNWEGFQHPQGGVARRCKKCSREDRSW